MPLALEDIMLDCRPLHITLESDVEFRHVAYVTSAPGVGDIRPGPPRAP
jgi:hypothetical protein